MGSAAGYQEWLDAKGVAATFLRELLPDPALTAEREDALTSALFARLAHRGLLVKSMPELLRAEKAEALLRRLVEEHGGQDWGDDNEELNAIVREAKAALGEVSP